MAETDRKVAVREREEEQCPISLLIRKTEQAKMPDWLVCSGKKHGYELADSAVGIPEPTLG